MIIDKYSYLCVDKIQYDFWKNKILSHTKDPKQFPIEIIKNLYEVILENKEEKSFIFSNTSLELTSKIKITHDVIKFLMTSLKNSNENEKIYQIHLKDVYFRYIYSDGVLFSMLISKDGGYGDIAINDRELDNLEAINEMISNKMVVTFLQLLIFLKYGDIEVKVIESGKKVGTRKDGYYNLSKNDITVVDSSWNKIIIRTKGFNVNGHLRLQPAGKNRAERKLKWINAFKKEGYKKIGKGIKQ